MKALQGAVGILVFVGDISTHSSHDTYTLSAGNEVDFCLDYDEPCMRNCSHLTLATPS